VRPLCDEAVGSWQEVEVTEDGAQGWGDNMYIMYLNEVWPIAEARRITCMQGYARQRATWSRPATDPPPHLFGKGSSAVD
jgi:hypothetical protein